LSLTAGRSLPTGGRNRDGNRDGNRDRPGWQSEGRTANDAIVIESDSDV
jgi:hypothetical protein